MKAHLVYNPAAGPRDMHRALRHVVDSIERHGWSVELKLTEKPGDATSLSEQAADAGLDVVIVAGGDGTLNEALTAPLEVGDRIYLEGIREAVERGAAHTAADQQEHREAEPQVLRDIEVRLSNERELAGDGDLAPIGDEVGESLVNGHKCKRHDEWFQFGPGDDQTHDQLEDDSY